MFSQPFDPGMMMHSRIEPACDTVRWSACVAGTWRLSLIVKPSRQPTSSQLRPQLVMHVASDNSAPSVERFITPPERERLDRDESVCQIRAHAEPAKKGDVVHVRYPVYKRRSCGRLSAHRVVVLRRFQGGTRILCRARVFSRERKLKSLRPGCALASAVSDSRSVQRARATAVPDSFGACSVLALARLPVSFRPARACSRSAEPQ